MMNRLNFHYRIISLVFQTTFQRAVRSQNFFNQIQNKAVFLAFEALRYLLSVEARAHVAHFFCVALGLLLHLQKLRGVH